MGTWGGRGGLRPSLPDPSRPPLECVSREIPMGMINRGDEWRGFCSIAWHLLVLLHCCIGKHCLCGYNSFLTDSRFILCMIIVVLLCILLASSTSSWGMPEVLFLYRASSSSQRDASLAVRSMGWDARREKPTLLLIYFASFDGPSKPPGARDLCIPNRGMRTSFGAHERKGNKISNRNDNILL
jgi:hypothetical protein